MRVIKWEKPSHRLTQAGIDRFYGSPLQSPTAFKFKTRKLDVPPHGGAFSLKFVLSGEEHYRIGTRLVKLRPGRLLFINADETYSSHIHTDTESVSVFVPRDDQRLAIQSVLQSDCDALAHEAGAAHSAEIPQIAFAPDKISMAALKQLLGSFNSSEINDAPEYLRLFLIHALRNLFGLAPSSGLQLAGKRSTRDELLQRLVRAKTQIDDSRGDHADLDELANTACLSKYYFLRLFRQTFGEAPGAYARRLRLKRAIDALNKGGALAATARRAGYDDARAFRRACKRMLGIRISQKSQL